MPRLKMLRGPSPGEEFELNEAVMTIGRGRKNHIIIQDNEVSRTHCRLVRVLDDYEIHDLGSTNGTFVSGQQIDEGGWLLGERTIVELGDSITLEYHPTDITGVGLSPVPITNEAEPESLFYLVIKQQSLEKPEIYILDRTTISIGRDADNEISLDEPEVSRHHMRLVLTADGYAVEDLNTMNGTAVNGDTIAHQQILNTNDLIGVGTGVQMWFTDDPNHLLAMIGTPGESAKQQATHVDEVTIDKSPEEVHSTDSKIQAENVLEPGDLVKSVFLLYAPEEWNVIGEYIYNYLKDNNIKVYTQQSFTPDTDDWNKALEQALAESSCLLAIISRKSLEVPHIPRSIRHFVAREKSVMLLRYGVINKVPTFIDKMPSIRFDTKHPDTTYRIILAELRRIGL